MGTAGFSKCHIQQLPFFLSLPLFPPISSYSLFSRDDTPFPFNFFFQTMSLVRKFWGCWLRLKLWNGKCAKWYDTNHTTFFIFPENKKIIEMWRSETRLFRPICSLHLFSLWWFDSHSVFFQSFCLFEIYFHRLFFYCFHRDWWQIEDGMTRPVLLWPWPPKAFDKKSSSQHPAQGVPDIWRKVHYCAYLFLFMFLIFPVLCIYV